jgi:hypothetical protein
VTEGEHPVDSRYLGTPDWDSRRGDVKYSISRGFSPHPKNDLGHGEGDGAGDEPRSDAKRERDGVGERDRAGTVSGASGHPGILLLIP